MKALLRNNLHALLILLIIGFSLSPLKLIGLAFIILYLAYLLPFKLDIYFRVLISFCIFFGMNTLVAAILYILKVPISVSFLFVLYAGILLFWPYTKVEKYNSRHLFNRFTLVKFFISLFVFMCLLAPTLHNDGFSIFRLVTTGGDNISHLEAVRAVRDNAGYFYQNAALGKNTLMEGLSSYPQGLHVNIVIAMETIQPIYSTLSSFRFVLFYYAYCVMIYIILAALFYLIIRHGFFKSGAREKVVIGLAVTFVLFSGTFYGLFAAGSQSQIASLMLFLGMLFLLGHGYHSQKERCPKFNIYLAFVLLSAISFTWLLLYPIAVLIMALYVIIYFAEDIVKRPIEHIPLLAIGILLSCIALIQVAVQALDSSPKNAGINEPGFSIHPSIYVVLGFVLLSTVFLLVIYKKVSKVWLFSLVASTLFSGAIYLHQWVTVGEARYYFYKSLYVVFIVIALIFGAGISKVIEREAKNLGRFQSFSIFGVILVFGAIVTIYNVRNPADFFAQRKSGGFSKELSVTAIKLLNDNPANGGKIIAVGSCNRAQDYTLTRLVAALSGENDSYHQSLIGSQLLQNKNSLYLAIKRYQKVHSPDIIIISSDYQLQQYLSNKLNDGYGSERFIDIDLAMP